MSLYQANDINLLLGKWDDILSEVDKQKLLLLEPKIEEMREVHNICLNFVKNHKRKMYGGYALNMLIKDKNPADAFYKNDKIPDIDFYSPEPIVDIIKLCNLLHQKGYKYVIGREAMHQETYTISVNYLAYCDISYVPKNIYNRMPFKEINGYHLIHPHFMTIDYLRMMTDPLISYWRFEADLKSFKRFFLLQKYYPLPFSNNPIDIDGSTPTIDSAIDTVFKFLLNKKSVIVIGFYAYNYFLNASKLLDKKNKFKLLSVPYFEFISTDYRNDSLKLIDALKSNVTLNKDDIKHSEFYPFFQFTGHSVDIYLGEDLIARIYNHNKKCIPFQDVPAMEFKDGKSNIVHKSTIRLCTFPFVLLYSLISIMRARTNNDEDTKDLYYTMTSHLIEMRNNYFNVEKKSYLDNSLFREFIVECAGETISPDRQRRLLIESRKKKNKKYTFSYEPSDGVKEAESNYVFANSSGNIIVNPKNLRLAPLLKEEDIEGDFDDDDASHSTDAKSVGE